MDNTKSEKQKKLFIILLSSIVLLFTVFVFISIKLVNSNKDNKGLSNKIATETASTSEKDKTEESSTAKKDKDESATVSSTTKEESNEIVIEENKDNENLGKDSKEDDSNKEAETSKPKESSSKENNPSGSNTNISSNNISNTEVNKEEENNVEEKPKFIVNIRIKMVNENLFSSQIVLENEVTAFEALKYYCESNSLDLGYSGSGQFSYVTSINGIKERSEGPSSGWMYSVNGEFVKIAAGKCKLSSNDTLEWVFTKDGGKDIGER